jgi:S1-C subfamily serine protease
MLDFASSADVEDIGGAPAAPDADILDAYSHAVTSVAETIGPAVVRVEVRNAQGRPGGVGSGVVIAPDGLVLTNCHVVEGAKELHLQDAEGRVMEARKLGQDPDAVSSSSLSAIRSALNRP